MKVLSRLLLTAIAVLILAYILPGISVASSWTSLSVAIVLALLRIIVKPVLILLTLPITIFTFGLFLLVINAMIILMVDHFLSGFTVAGFWYAIIFSLLLSLFQSLLFKLIPED